MAVIKVAEIGINHNGDINIAKKLIDVAKANGMEYVKFQKRTLDLYWTPAQLNRVRESPFGKTYRDEKEALEFGLEEYLRIDQYCKDIGIKWFASPWDCVSVDFLTQFNPDYIKVPSALITSKDYLERIKFVGIPVIISTGMSTIREIDEAVGFLGKQIKYILACTASYPTETKEMNLNFIQTLKGKYPRHKIGFSNHAASIIFIPIAVALGAEMVEFHITLDRAMWGFDQAASIEGVGVERVCRYIEDVELAMGDGVKKVYESEKPMIDKLRRW